MSVINDINKNEKIMNQIVENRDTPFFSYIGAGCSALLSLILVLMGLYSSKVQQNIAIEEESK